LVFPSSGQNSEVKWGKNKTVAEQISGLLKISVGEKKSTNILELISHLNEHSL
jgi:hypothetical protein